MLPMVYSLFGNNIELDHEIIGANVGANVGAIGANGANPLALLAPRGAAWRHWRQDWRTRLAH